jgi:hypothetical protein
MKLVDTYTNMCFVAILVNTQIHRLNGGGGVDHLGEQEAGSGASISSGTAGLALEVNLPMYMLIVSLVSMGIYMLFKAVATIFLIVFTCVKLRSFNQRSASKKQRNELSDPERNLEVMTRDIQAHIE